jgi:hypothetical protein
VKVLAVQPDPPHQQLTTRATLIASYQKTVPGGRAAAPAPAAAAPLNKQPSPPVQKAAVTNPAPPVRAGTNKNLTPIKK